MPTNQSKIPFYLSRWFWGLMILTSAAAPMIIIMFIYGVDFAVDFLTHTIRGLTVFSLFILDNLNIFQDTVSYVISWIITGIIISFAIIKFIQSKKVYLISIISILVILLHYSLIYYLFGALSS